MRLLILRRSLRDQRRGLAWWAFSLIALCVVMLSFWPSLKSQAADFEKLIEGYPPAFKAFFGEMTAIGTGPGYLQVELTSLMLPLLFAFYAIARGSDAIAGDEERGSLELLIAEPTERSRIVLERAAAMGAGTAVLAAVTWVTLAAGDAALDMGVGTARLARVVLACGLFGTALGAVALAAGAARGKRGLAIAAGAALGVGSYLIEALARASGKLEWARPFLPFRQYAAASELVTEPQLWGLLALLATAIAAIAIAAWAFERRDVGV